jgi:hypothetical protein
MKANDGIISTKRCKMVTARPSGSHCATPESLLVKHQRNVDTSVFCIHDLIRIMVQESSTKNADERGWSECAVELICGAFGCVEDPECWPRCEMFTPHLQQLTLRDEMYGSQNITVTITQANIHTCAIAGRPRFCASEC